MLNLAGKLLVLTPISVFLLTSCQRNYPKTMSIGVNNMIAFPPNSEPGNVDLLGPCKAGLTAKISVNNKYIESPKVLLGESWSNTVIGPNMPKIEDFGPNSQILVEAWCNTGDKIGYSKRTRSGHNGYRLSIGVSAPNSGVLQPNYVIQAPGPEINFENDKNK